MQNKALQAVTFILLVVGGLNWFMVGLADMTVVNMVLGNVPILERAVYVLVGLSAVYELINRKKRSVMM